MLRKLRRQWSGRWIRFTPLVPPVRGRWSFTPSLALSHLSVPVLRLSLCVLISTFRLQCCTCTATHELIYGVAYYSAFISIIRLHVPQIVDVFCNTKKFWNLVGKWGFLCFWNEQKHGSVVCYQRSAESSCINCLYLVFLASLNP